MTQPQDKYIEEALDEVFAKSSLYNSWDGCREDLIKFIRTALLKQQTHLRETLRERVEKLSYYADHDMIAVLQEEAKKEERTRLVRNVGMLRQWLNEDRITDLKKMVTNEELLHWLELQSPSDTEGVKE